MINFALYKKIDIKKRERDSQTKEERELTYEPEGRGLLVIGGYGLVQRLHAVSDVRTLVLAAQALLDRPTAQQRVMLASQH